MRQFFRYYGSKMRLAPYYDRPEHDVVIEPFAGGAGYSTYWAPRVVHLYDLHDEIVALWDYLINCSVADIERLPDTVDHSSDLYKYSFAEERLMYRWMTVTDPGTSATPKDSNLDLHKRELAQGGTSWWSPRIKRRLIAQKPRISEWTITQASYEDIPNVLAHWHIDPPYRCDAGDKYKHPATAIDFDHLADWCRSREGAVDVCEMEGADWLPFETLRRQPANGWRTTYTEVIWRNRPARQASLL